MRELTEIRPDLRPATQKISGPETQGALLRVTHPVPHLPDPHIRVIGHQRFRLEDEDCMVPDFRRRRFHVVEEGFEFDGASVPRIAWALISPLDLGTLAVLSHDWLYAFGGLASPHRYTRKEADILFYDLMTLTNIPTWRRASAYRAVRMFGGLTAWQRGG